LIVFIFSGLVLAYIIANHISKPIVHASKYIGMAAEENFTQTIFAKYLDRGDKIGQLAKIHVKNAKIHE